MSRQRTQARLSFLEAHQPTPKRAALLTDLARRYDLSEKEILAEAEYLTEQYRQRGLVTTDQIMAYVADDLGITVDELLAELRAIGISGI